MDPFLTQVLEKFFPKSTEGASSNSVYTINERATAALSYIYFASTLILLFSTSDSGFVKLHAKHALFYLILTVLSFLLPGPWNWYLFAVIALISFVSAFSAFKGRLIVIPRISALLQSFDI